MAGGERHIDIRPRQERETFDENTLFKVLDSLLTVGGLEFPLARDVISDMQNKGILFRERMPESSTGTTCR